MPCRTCSVCPFAGMVNCSTIVWSQSKQKYPCVSPVLVQVGSTLGSGAKTECLQVFACSSVLVSVPVSMLVSVLASVLVFVFAPVSASWSSPQAQSINAKVSISTRHNAKANFLNFVIFPPYSKGNHQSNQRFYAYSSPCIPLLKNCAQALNQFA